MGTPPPVSDEELAAVGRAFPALIHALKSAGGPPAASLREALARVPLGPRHINALQTVAASGPMSVSELAAHLGVALPTASLMVAELSRGGLLVRVEDDADRRRTIVRVAPEHEADVRDFLARKVEPLRRALGRLTAAERAGFLAGLTACAEEMGADAGSHQQCPEGGPAHIAT